MNDDLTIHKIINPLSRSIKIIGKRLAAGSQHQIILSKTTAFKFMESKERISFIKYVYDKKVSTLELTKEQFLLIYKLAKELWNIQEEKTWKIKKKIWKINKS